MGCDSVPSIQEQTFSNFNPRTHRGVRRAVGRIGGITVYISIHAPIVGCDEIDPNIKIIYDISIHAPIVGCDKIVRAKNTIRKISIHAPIVGCDALIGVMTPVLKLFQSTHPSWGATFFPGLFRNLFMHFNPRTHRGVRLQK